MISSRVAAFSACLLLAATLAGAQETNAYTPTRPLALGDVLLSLPTSHIPGPHEWEVKFTHRFNQSLDEGNLSDRVHNLFGLDSNANVGIAVSYVVHPRVQVSFYRSNALDDIELDAKYVVVQQAQAIPLSAALRAGVDWRTEKDLDDRTSLFAQAILSRQLGERIELFAMPTYVTKAGRAVGEVNSKALFKNAFNVPVGAAFLIRGGLSLVGEIYPVNRDLPDTMDAEFGWAFGLKRAIGGHHFEVMLTNNIATHVDQYVTSTYLGSPLRRGDLHIGFNIERRFGRR